MTVKVGFIKHPFKSVGKASANVTGAMGQRISDVFISPISALTNTATDAFSDITSSPLLMVGVGLIGVIAISSIFKASDTANKFAENPESITALAQAMR
jgi:hypothetical protein